MPDSSSIVNDIHSQLNATRVHQILRPESIDEVRDAVRTASERPLAIAGGRHAMGGQQYAQDADLLDLTGLAGVIDFDAERDEIEAEAGIMWPALIDWLHAAQPDVPRPWSIIQKQTGADCLTLGGALSANVHGRVLRHPPIIADVVAFTLVDASGQLRRCSREENTELFRLAIGGYGLFGPIVSVRLRLARRHKVRREVAVLAVEDVVATLEARAAEGCEYGDFQFAIDPAGDDFLRQGICAVYRPVPDETPIPEGQRRLSRADWEALITLSHTDPRRASDTYTRHYLATDGQIYWSDAHQLADYHDGYHVALDQQLGAAHPGSEMITELYMPRQDLPRFMTEVAADFRQHATQVIYGTVRLIERDDESFLAWARQSWVCIIFNLHVDHTPDGIESAATAFRRLIDHALSLGGTFYLTYHRWATREQVEAAYPQFPAFLAEKRQHDPEERFQSEWYRYYRAMFRSEFLNAGEAG